jgi:hypothetical protein
MVFHKSTSRNVKTTKPIQYVVVSANMEVVMARSHFRARLWSPLVLSHHKKALRKKGHQADYTTDALHHGVNCDGNKTQIYSWDTWKVSNQHGLHGRSGRNDHRAVFGILGKQSVSGSLNCLLLVDFATWTPFSTTRVDHRSRCERFVATASRF